MTQTEDEIPLEDIDKILAEEDPDFAKSLEEVRSVEVDTSVVIEASAIDETMGDEGSHSSGDSDEGKSFLRKHLDKIKNRITQFRLSLKLRLIKFAADSLIFVKTKPKEYSLYLLVLGRHTVKSIERPLKAFMAAPRIYQAGVLIFITLVGMAVSVLFANIRGIWIPHLMEPILKSLSDEAEYVETFDPKTDTESFYSAFPQEVHQFLFNKFKVNLKRTAENPNPMGAFEVVVEVDSKDTAVEISDREVELHDFLQRIFEDEPYSELASDLGKSRVKGRIKREMNTKLTQGWIRDVNFNTFILKP